MMISLVRHGRPAVDYRTRIPGTALGTWLAGYGAADIDLSLPPPDELRRTLGGCGLLITSDARRALQSGDVLSLPTRRLTLAMAGEAPLPGRIVWPIKLRPQTAMVVARSLWLLGWSTGIERKPEVMARARRLATELEALVREVDHVAVIGHGYMHRFTASALRQMGWSTVRTAHGFWSVSQFRKLRLPEIPAAAGAAIVSRACEPVERGPSCEHSPRGK